MKYPEIMDRKIFILCTSIETIKQVHNFLRYKNFDLGDGEFYYKTPFKGFVGMGIYLRSDSKYGTINASNKGILQDNNAFGYITDTEFLKSNKLTIAERLGRKPFGFIK